VHAAVVIERYVAKWIPASRGLFWLVAPAEPCLVNTNFWPIMSSNHRRWIFSPAHAQTWHSWQR